MYYYSSSEYHEITVFANFVTLSLYASSVRSGTIINIYVPPETLTVLPAVCLNVSLNSPLPRWLVALTVPLKFQTLAGVPSE